MLNSWFSLCYLAGLWFILILLQVPFLPSFARPLPPAIIHGFGGVRNAYSVLWSRADVQAGPLTYATIGAVQGYLFRSAEMTACQLGGEAWKAPACQQPAAVEWTIRGKVFEKVCRIPRRSLLILSCPT